MKVSINHIAVQSEFIQVPDFNFGQFQRLKEFDKLPYEAIVDRNEFIKLISGFFSEFRALEIEDEDTLDHQELIAYKNIGRPTLTELFENHHTILTQILLFNNHDILKLLFRFKIPENYTFMYLIQSIETIAIKENNVVLEGVCVRVDRRK